MNIKIITAAGILLLISIITAPALSKETENNKAADKSLREFGREYFPIDGRLTLFYTSTFGDTKSSITRDGNSYLFSNSADGFKYRQKLEVDSSGVFIDRTYQKFKVLLFITKEGTYIYSKPLLRIPFPLYKGREWNWSGAQFSGGDTSSVDLSGECFGIDTLSTGAGKFTAVKVRSTLTTSDGTKNIITEWYAKNIGLIKMHVEVQGGGIMGVMRDILGYGDIDFRLKKIERG